MPSQTWLTKHTALHLQKLYERLIDYEPSIEYSDRLKQLSRAVGTSEHARPPIPQRAVIGTRGIWTSLLAQKEKRDSVALTRVLTSHEAAMNLESPKGLMLHGEVGTGKSLLIDMFADCLPNRKKRRWHFNTFMLETISRLEQLRKSRSASQSGNLKDEYSLLWLARDLVEKSPILFLDEFQLPDRVASKILSNLMTSFFQLGGVLIATSNRIPEELAKAAGMEFTRPVSRLSRLGWRLGMSSIIGKEDGPGQRGEFSEFLQVLRARCEVWEMEGKKDYRRIAGLEQSSTYLRDSSSVSPDGHELLRPNRQDYYQNGNDQSVPEKAPATHPKYYFITPPSNVTELEASPQTQDIDEVVRTFTSTPQSQPVPWAPASLTVYGRSLYVPKQHHGTALFTFAQLCGEPLGPADYITLASTYHTLIITGIPIFTFLLKNEARRFITLLDAMYEARCRLLITAAASPDGIFFPSAPVSSDSRTGTEALIDDAVHPETYSEIHQDLTSPFRPNVSSYGPSSASLPIDALEDDPPNRFRRPGSSYTDERKLSSEGAKSPDFANIGGLTGEDERFAVKRAESRIWEMCSASWWNRTSSGLAGEELTEQDISWWRPLPLSSRHWERTSSSQPEIEAATTPPAEGITVSPESHEDITHGSSLFRNAIDPPPKIQWTHVWGTVKWGKRAGAWGKGVEGLEERAKEKLDGMPTNNEDKK